MTAIWHARLDTLREVIRADIARGDYFGAVLTVGPRRRGGVRRSARGRGRRGREAAQLRQRVLDLLGHQGVHQRR
jgi:hypothetical protein